MALVSYLLVSELTSLRKPDPYLIWIVAEHNDSEIDEPSMSTELMNRILFCANIFIG